MAKKHHYLDTKWGTTTFTATSTFWCDDGSHLGKKQTRKCCRIANAAKLAPSTDLTSKQKTILQFSESIPRSNQNSGLSGIFNHTEIMTANYYAQHSVCLFTELPQELCTSPWLNSEITLSVLSHTEKNIQCLHMGIFTIAANNMHRNEEPVLGRAKGEQGQANSSLRSSRTLSSLMEEEIQDSHSCRSSRCCMQGLKEEKHSHSLEMQRGNISPCLICVHHHCSGKVLLDLVGSLAKEIHQSVVTDIFDEIKSFC